MAEPRFCYRHAGHAAHRRCYNCRRAICPGCQIKIDHHLFCGRSCHEEYLQDLSSKVNPGYKRYVAYVTVALLLVGFLYFALLADAFYSGGNAQHADTTHAAQISLSLPLQMNEQPAEQIMIRRPLNGFKSSAEHVRVEGIAPPNSVVGIYVNGSLIDNTVARDGTFHFPQMRLTEYANVLQTRYYATNGFSDSSSSILVYYEHSATTRDHGSRFFQNGVNNFSRGDITRKQLAITFNGDTIANSCSSILEVLDHANISATMFLTDEFIRRKAEFTRRMSAEHQIGILYSGGATKEELQNQLRRTEQAFRNETGKEIAPYWRSNRTIENIEMLQWASELGYIHVAWTADPATGQNLDALDWISDSRSPGYFPAYLIKDRLLTFGHAASEQANGSILMMQLGTERKAHDRLDEILPEIISTFRLRGYEFLTVGELMSRNEAASSK